MSPDARIDWSEINRVALIRLRSIGDTVLMTPCLAALRDWRPDLEITAVSEPLAAPILEGHSLLNRLIVVDKDSSSRVRGIRLLRACRPQLAFNLHGGSTAMLMAKLSGARHAVGYDSLPGSWMANRRAPAPDRILNRATIHSVEQQLALLHWTGVPLPSKPRLGIHVSERGLKLALEAMKRSGIEGTESARWALIAPGAAFESKRWSEAGFAAVIDYLAEHWRLKSLVVTGPGQNELAARVASQSRSSPIVLPDLKLGQVVALTRALGAIFVGNDSGLMHIAAAMECPIVAVFGSSNPDVWRPWCDSPCAVLGGERMTKDSDVKGSIDRVATEDVIAAVERVLSGASAERSAPEQR